MNANTLELIKLKKRFKHSDATVVDKHYFEHIQNVLLRVNEVKFLTALWFILEAI